MIEQMLQRLRVQTDLPGALGTILNDVIALCGAQFGNVQLAVNGDALVLVDQRGLDAFFLESFARVSIHDGTACGRALRTGRPVVIKDVDLDKDFEPYRKIAREVGFRSVQSVPLIARDRTPVGVVSTHFSLPNEPTRMEKQILEAYGPAAGDFLKRFIDPATIPTQADLLFRNALATANGSAGAAAAG